MESWDVEFAGMFKERNNKVYTGPQVGVVLSPPPNTRVRLGDEIILTMDHLIIAAHVLSGYKREFSSTSSGDIVTKTPPPETYDTYTVLESLDHDGEITLKDTLKIGDQVILIPASTDQTYFLIDKVG
ncbi:hypothetical protein HNQ80_004317 [Anaerosolibacter carboniphilus]|uniref:DUF2577 domain-containing protein n=1 Tax=Anaerosolibacter carboniphilus TaxID=1417629 RepID=A0A841KXU6_9FIRM|nr:DUF2577 domain-containing protein [Anaerosolibacter carboniphilus]MBB6218177.1 hypothetical protein [Anaerosolibacter carboniphilus]